jgi:hypothetical protein
MRYLLPNAVLEDTFGHLRACGAGRRECQALWVSPWTAPQQLTAVVHPRHTASAVGFQVDDDWLNGFWRQLADDGLGVRFQIHTHPGTAYHSSTDDAFPLIRTAGFLSLVVPHFAQGPIGFEGAYLTQVQPNGSWQEQNIQTTLGIM